MMLIGYQALLVLGLIVVYLPVSLWRRRLPHRGWTMRLGCYPADVRSRLADARPTIWLHAVSVGEAIAAKPLVAQLRRRYPHVRLVISTITPTGFAVASKDYAEVATVIVAPFDLRWCVARAFRLIRPSVLLLMESELWPVWIDEAQRQEVPVAVVNGRMSERAFNRYQRVRGLMTRMMRSVSRYLMQSQVDAARIRRLGAPEDRVAVLGSLKWDASLGSRPEPSALDALKSRIGWQPDQPLIVAGSTHRGEETALLDALKQIRQQQPAARLIIAPRHIERAADIERLVGERGFSVRRVSRVPGSEGTCCSTQRVPSEPGTDVLIIDTLGQLPSYYALATVVFVGGSLIPRGGQNPLEPAGLGKPVVFGPSMDNFAEIAQQLIASEAAVQLRGPHELAPTLLDLLQRPDYAQQLGRNAKATVERCRGASDRILLALDPLLTRLQART